MKPTHHISSHREPSPLEGAALRGRKGFPLTDCNFHPTAEPRGSGLSERDRHASEVRTFRILTTRFFGTEASRNFVAELILFLLIAGVSAWPIISMIAALRQMLK